jgi:hypothetical protein
LPMFYWSHGTKDEGYRRLEQKLDKNLAVLFQATIASYDPDSLYSALIKEIELFRMLRDKVFEHNNLSVDPSLENMVIRGMEHNWKLFKGSGKQ